MDASSSQEKIVEPPRHLFFGVEDRRLGGRAGLDDKYLAMEKRRRKQLAEHVKGAAGQIIGGVRTLEDFDRTGNADQALDHLNAARDDLNKKLDSLIAEVEKSVDRYGDGLDELAARDADAQAALNPQTPAAAALSPQVAAAAGPKPGPGPAVILNVGDPGSCHAQVKSNLQMAVNRAGR